MIRLLLVLLLMWQPPTAIQIQLLDEHNSPVAHVQLQLDHGQSIVIETNTDGIAILNPAQGPVVFVRAAILPDGTHVPIDPNTPHDGLRLALIPQATRFVTLRLADGLLFLDPEHLFSGELVPPVSEAMSELSAGSHTVDRPPPERYTPILKLIGRVALSGLFLSSCVWLLRIAHYRRRKRP